MSAYIGDVVKNGLVLYLDAANSKSYVSGSSTWFDLSGNNNSGTLTNGPTFSSDGKGSIIFDGTNDHIIASASSVWNISTGTIECWVMVSGDVGYRGIFGSFIASFTGYAFALNSLSTKLEFLVGYGIGQSFKYIQSNENYVKNRWYHLAGTFGSGGALFYVDGVLQTDKTTTAVGAPGNLPLTIGRLYHDTNDYYFNGRVASGKIYNRILSPAEILENYNATKGRFDTPRAINSVQPRLVTNGLVMCLDAGNRESYVSGSNIIYDLIPKRSTTVCGTVAENGTLTLTAPANYVFTSVDFASYGTPNGSCGSFTTSSCHSATSYTYVASQLLGKTGSVSIGATNANFGDPCGGQVKRLYVQATATALLTTTGSLVNNPTFNSANGGILNFDGVDDFGSISCESFQSGNNAFSMESWFKWFGNGTNTSNFIFGYGSDTGQHRVPFIAVISSKLLFEFGSNSGPVSSSTTIQTNTWYQGTAVYDKSTTKIYLNGINENTTNYSSASIILSGSNGTNAGIGCLFSQFGNVVSAPRRYGTFNGSIGIVKYYNRALSADEVLQNYNSTKGRFGL